MERLRIWGINTHIFLVQAFLNRIIHVIDREKLLRQLEEIYGQGGQRETSYSVGSTVQIQASAIMNPRFPPRGDSEITVGIVEILPDGKLVVMVPGSRTRYTIQPEDILP